MQDFVCGLMLCIVLCVVMCVVMYCAVVLLGVLDG